MARWFDIAPFDHPHRAQGPKARRHPGDPGALMEPLEARTLLFSATMMSAFPVLSNLENPNNTVVRFHTNMGVIDFELFDSVAPGTVENFIDYVRKGAYDGMFFHRAIDEANAGIGVIQGGGYKFTNLGGLATIPADPPIQNEFQRLNVAGTISMAKLGGQPNSATSQFFINTQNNPELDNPANSGGFTVFGRVVQGWTTVTKIDALTVHDMDVPLTGAPGTLFDTVPLANSSNPSVATEGKLVIVFDAEIIKRGGVLEYYDEAVYYPEGWRGPGIVERVDLANNSIAQNHYQIIVRYENGDRDSVIATGVLDGRAHRTITISNGANPALNLVRTGVGYAIEVRSTLPLAAALNHRDFGTTIAESFFRAEDMNDSWLTNWTFAHGEEGPDFQSFLVLQNLSHKDAAVVVTVFPATGPALTFTLKVDTYGRGVKNLWFNGVLPNGRYSVRVTSSVPIVAALSVYEKAAGVSNGSTAVGTMASGRSEGYLAAARIPSGGSSFLSFLHHGSGTILVDVFFYLSNGTTLQAPNPVTLSNFTHRLDKNLASFGVALPANQFFSVGYQVRNHAAPITVTYVSEHSGDTLSTPFTTVSSGMMHFADGYMDPGLAGTTYDEIISLFNPYQRENVIFEYRVQFRFSDGTWVDGAAGVLGANERIDLRAHEIGTVLAKVNSGAQFRFYSVVIETSQRIGETRFFGAGVAQITRVHGTAGHTLTSQPTLDEVFPLLFMNSATFDP